MHDGYYVYILATWKGGPIYVGVTNDLHRRVYEHKAHAIRLTIPDRGFTASGMTGET
jgi:predicted GIY-YIG superfamily endonuclease